MNSSTDKSQHISLDDILDISTSGELKIKLLSALEGDTDVVLEAASIEKADTSALQVLTAFVNDARTKGLSVTWLNPSEVLLRSADLIGLKDYLGFSEPAA